MRRIARRNARPILLSFSGIDGCGKSTQIEILVDRLKHIGLRVRVLAFWDDVAVLKRFREATSHTVFGSEKGIGTPDNPVDRRDKNVQSWYMTPVRWLLYLLDAISLSELKVKTERWETDVVILDRYLHDELANLPLHRSLSNVWARFLLNAAPRPDIAFWIDADPVEARERKPEYPLEFLYRVRESYATLSRMSGMTPIQPGTVEQVCARVMRGFLRRFPVARITDFPPVITAAPDAIAEVAEEVAEEDGAHLSTRP